MFFKLAVKMVGLAIVVVGGGKALDRYPILSEHSNTVILTGSSAWMMYVVFRALKKKRRLVTREELEKLER